jgi:hypothetical protein
MLGEADVITLGVLGLRWMMPPEAFPHRKSINTSSRQSSCLKPSLSPAVLRHSAVKTGAPHEVSVALNNTHSL